MQGKQQKKKKYCSPLFVHMIEAFVGVLPCVRSLCLQVYNLGTGRGYSVLQMVKAMEKASGRKVSGKRVWTVFQVRGGAVSSESTWRALEKQPQHIMLSCAFKKDQADTDHVIIC